MLAYAGNELGIFGIVFTGLLLEVDVVVGVVAGCMLEVWAANS